MAKQPTRSTTTGKVKVRVLEFEMDGSDESIQDTMKTLAAAFSRGGYGAAPVRRLKSDVAASVSNSEEAAGETEEPEEAEEIQDVVARSPSAPRKARKVQSYDILDNIRFDGTPMNLTDFAAQYSPKSDLKKYLVIASWYKDQLKVAEINVRHWYTAYKYLKWTIPNDPAQPIRDLRADKKLSKGTSTGHVYINHIGEKDMESLVKSPS